MAWVKIDDQFTDHPKAADAGPLGIAMQVAGLCYANRHLTDGFISHKVAARLLDFTGIAVDGLPVHWQDVVGSLCLSGWWWPIDGGWQIELPDIGQEARNTADYREWRSAVFDRDDYACQHCGAEGVPFHAHHLRAFAECPELRFEIANGITLCTECHSMVHGRRLA